MKVVGIALISPNIVVTRASDIPPAIVFGSPVPNSVIAWKVFIIPMIVPKRPNKGEITEINNAIVDDPSMVNNDPTGEAWFFKMSLKNQGELDGLMS